MVPPQWICAQIGAREHYAIPRSLHARDRLFGSIADAWVPPRSIWQLIPGRAFRSLKERYHPDLAAARTQAFTADLVRFELGEKVNRRTGWPSTMARNRWFQRRALQVLQQWQRELDAADRPPVLFAYSYAALDLFQFARSLGWTTVLGQIDPGPEEEAIVRRETERHPNLAGAWQAAPTAYWDAWRQECAITDRIVVNSPWSQQALATAGVDPDKLHVVPLAYQPPAAARAFQRTYPDRFDRERPLRVLFLGQVILRKGLSALLDAADRTRSLPVEFWIAGGIGIARSALHDLPNVRWIGSVPRSQTADYYRQADVFLFPTLSDGFGLTQLEAQAWQLPAIASRYCGSVTTDAKNGWVLAEVSGEAIASVLETCLEHPCMLRNFAETGVNLSHWSLASLYNRLDSILN
ncbi:MAG: glycosyltransferase family 4 protein [Cyanobacteria bacterium J06639_1]